jgi:hypothetical protein
MALAGAILAILAALYVLAIKLPRKFWKERLARRAPLWVRGGWAPGLLVLLVAAAHLPLGPATVGSLAVAGALLAYWAIITGDPDRRPGEKLWYLRLGLNEATFLLLWWPFLAGARPDPVYTQLSMALAAGFIINSVGVVPLVGLWRTRLHRRGRTCCRWALVAVTAASAVLLGQGAQYPALNPLATAGVIAAVLLHRVPSFDLGPRLFRARAGIMALGGAALIYAATCHGADMLLWGGALLLAEVGFTALAALVADR